MFKKYVAYALVKRGSGKSVDPVPCEYRQDPQGQVNFNDSYYFTGHNDAGEYLITRLGFRGDGSAELWFDINIKDFGKLSLPDDTYHPGLDISCGPVKYICIEPLKEWDILYDGVMMSGKKEHRVKYKVRYSATSPLVDFKRHTDPWSIAENMAKEKWTREWFEKLRDLGQIHFEQGGTMKGSVTVDGKEYALDMRSLRDHSFGIRDWGAMERHLWVAALLEDGRFLNLAMVRYDFIKFMHSGYCADQNQITPLVKTGDFSLVPKGDPSGKTVEIPLRLRGGKDETLVCSVHDCVPYHMGRAYAVKEGVARFTLGSVKGVGIFEHGFDINKN